MDTAFVQRKIECLNDDAWEPGAINVYQPKKTDKGWACRYEVTWPGFSRGGDIYGVDSFQAIELAMRIVPTEISSSCAFKESRLRLFGEDPALNPQTLLENFPIHMKQFGDEQ